MHYLRFMTCMLTCYLFVAGCSVTKYQATSNHHAAWTRAAEQAETLYSEMEQIHTAKPELVSPRTLSDDGSLIAVRRSDWTSGFFPGVLWHLYAHTGDESWLMRARHMTAFIKDEQYNGSTHDMGFKVYCSVGIGYRLTGDTAYKNIIIQSAKTLATRYSPTVGAIRSWDHSKEKWDYPVIIDNMLNLELLFAATRLTGDSTFYQIAVNHAETTLKNHFRPDYSTYHVIGYDPTNGAVLKRNTHQGYSNESTWARGQAWALYGYTMCYRETGKIRYLRQAEQVAKWLFDHQNMPSDLVPYWDFDAPDIPNEPRDASAAAVIASGLLELSTFSANKKQYRQKAQMILRHLTDHYLSAPGENKGFILLHSTGSKPAKLEVDKPLSYADYYYLEAISRAEHL